MRIEILILGITIFYIYNAYHDNKYTNLFLSYKKYYKMAFYGIVGFSLYLFLKRNPTKGREMLVQANNIVKYLPIDKKSLRLMDPILDFTTNNQSNRDSFDLQNYESNRYNNNFSRMTNSGDNHNDNHNQGNHKTVKRSVSETKKKYIASQQEWSCASCKHKLDHTFEIDHKVRLEYGGGNEVQNLVALCRNCHGIKTASENM